MTLIVKPNNIQELGPVDISELKQLINRMPDKIWEMEDANKENNFAVFHHTQHIIFRFIHSNNDHLNFYSNPIWSVWQTTLLPIMEAVVAPYDFIQPTYPKAMLARLKAGSVIDRHIDGRGSNLHTHKIHIPLQTNPKALFSVKDVTQHLEEGIAYEVNNVKLHGVVNKGEEDRIHFIFEVYDNAVQ